MIRQTAAATGCLAMMVLTPSSLVLSNAGNTEGGPSEGFQLVGQIGGATTAVAVAGAYAYAGVGPRLAVFDVHDRAAPRQLGQSVILPGLVDDVALAGAVAYVADGGGGLRLLDVSDSSRPRETSVVHLGDPALAVALLADRALVATGTDRLHVVDVAEAARAYELAAVPVAGDVRDVAVSGHYVYLATDARADGAEKVAGSGGLRILDVGDPAHPREVGAVPSTSQNRAIAVAAPLVFTTAEDGLHVFDAADPSRPRELAVLATPGDYGPNGLTVGDGYAFLADSWACMPRPACAALRVIDARDPAHPAEVTSLAVPDASGQPVLSGSTLFLANRRGGLRLVDVTDPTAPADLAAVEAPGPVEHVTAGDGIAYLTGRRSGQDGDSLRLVDIRRPDHPTPVSDLQLARTADGCGYEPRIEAIATAGHHVFLADASLSFSGLLRMVEVMDPARPREVGYHVWELPPEDLAAEGTRVYAAVGEGGLWVVDEADPAGPRVTGQMAAWPGGVVAHRVATSGNYAYLLAYRTSVPSASSLRVVDVSDPADPREVAGLAPYAGLDIATVGQRLFIVGWSSGANSQTWQGWLSTVDASDPTNPREIGRLPLSASPWRVEAFGDQLYLYGGAPGVLVVDVRDAESPRLVDSIDTPVASDVSVVGNHVLIAAGAWGLEVYAAGWSRIYVPLAIRGLAD